MICDRHDVVVVPYPFHEINVRKRRPVVVHSSRRFNELNGWTVVAMVTTAKRSAWPSDIVISDLESAGLKTPCVMRLRFQTLPNEILIQKIGALSAIDRLAAEGQFAGIIA